MKVAIECLVTITEDELGKDIHFGPDRNKAKSSFSNMLEKSADRFTLAPSATITLSIGAIDPGSVKGLYVLATDGFDIEYNGSGLVFECRRGNETNTGEQVMHLMPAVNITSVEITNPSSTATLIGRFAFWGNPAS